MAARTAAKSKTAFEFEEKPRWRTDDVTTSAMAKYITGFRKQYDETEEVKRKRFSKKFAKVMAVDYIHNLNRGEMVGTQTLEDTEEVILRLVEKSDSDNLATEKIETINPEKINPEKIETINTYKAMRKLYDLHEEMEWKGIITVQQMNTIHGTLLKSLHPECGNIRENDAYTHWDNGPYFYPPPEKVEGLLYALVDHHTVCMVGVPLDRASNDYTVYIFKCAARLLFEVVNTHPYGDGNGRMCRLLANYIVGLITPFPVALYHKHEGRNVRKDYIDAIVRCRDHPEEGPRELAAMLVEGAWHGWKKFFSNLERKREISIVVKKSSCTVQYVSEKLDHVWKDIETKDVKMTKEEVVKLAMQAALKADTDHLERAEYLPITVSLDSSVHLLIDVVN